MSIEDLMSLEGIDKKLAKKMITANIRNVIELAYTDKSKLTGPIFGIGISLQLAEKLIKAAQERCSALFPVKRGETLLQEVNERQHLTSGTKSLDNILYNGKGFETQNLYELYGPPGAGKTDLLHQLVCTAYLPPEQVGLGGGTIYIDTKGVFSQKKIRTIAQRLKVDFNGVRQNILRVTPQNSDELLYFCETLLERMAHQRGARLFCLDNIATHFQAEYAGMGEKLPERSQRVNRILHALKRAAQNINGVAIYTNQMKKDKKHALGTAIGHEAHVRILVEIKDLSKGTRVFTIVKAIDLPEQDITLKLSEAGFSDLRYAPKTEKKFK